MSKECSTWLSGFGELFFRGLKMKTLDIMAIPLTQGLFALVDGKDYKWLNQHKWYAHKSRNTYYAYRRYKQNGKSILISMHRQILGLTKGNKKQTDHKNHNGLDNRRYNIRSCTHGENQHNRRTQNGVSKYKGVFWHKRDKKWQCQIKHNGEHIYLGSFVDEIDAAKAYDRKARELFGEFASCNF